MATQKKTTKKNLVQSYRISRVLTSLTFLGTMWRTALFVAALLAVVLLNVGVLLSAVPGVMPPAALQEALFGIIIYTAVFAIYDALYVYIVRRYREMDIADKIILFGLELSIAIVMLLTAAFTSSVSVNNAVYNETYSFVFWVLVMAALLLPLRAFVGVSYVVMTRKTK